MKHGFNMQCSKQLRKAIAFGTLEPISAGIRFNLPNGWGRADRLLHLSRILKTWDFLNKAVGVLPNISVATIGLSNEGGHAAFRRGKDQFGTTSMIVRELTGDEPQTIVVVSGDEIIAKNDARAPNLIKIDVEGHELEVLKGMTATLKRPELRELFVEVHFAVLEEQGRRHVPSAIEEFIDVQWIQIDMG